MASTLSLEDYLRYFLLKPSAFECGSDGSEKTIQGALLVATVYKQEKGGESMIYSKRMLGEKNADPVSLFLQDMTGYKDKPKNGNHVKTSSTMDLTEENEGKLPRNCTVSFDLLSNTSPSNIAAEQLLKLLEYCKRNSIRTSIQLNFAHPFSWDNKYNKQGIKQLQEKGIKFKAISFQQVINMMINDMQDNLESLDELETCRGTISIDYYMLKRAVAKFRDALVSNNDRYYCDNEDKLREILAQQKPKPFQLESKKIQFTNFSVETYRDYFFLQNTDEIWAKLRICLSKIKHGLTKEELLFDSLYHSDEVNRGKKSNPLAEKKLEKLTEKIWDTVAESITLKELAAHDDLIVTITMTISEYPDRMKWHTTVQYLQRHLAGRLHEAGMRKMRIESFIRYAMNISCDQASDDMSGRSTPSTLSGQSSKVEADRDYVIAIPECMHVQDMLFDMLEDLEDGMMKLGRIEYERGGSLIVDRLSLSGGMGLLNKAIGVRTASGAIYPMNSDFVDPYAESMNHL